MLFQGAVDKDKDLVVVIGGDGNTVSGVKLPNATGYLLQKATPNILACDEYMSFWITWENQVIKLGLGYFYGKNETLSYQASSTDFNSITAIGFDTVDKSGDFKFRENAGTALY